MTSTSLAAATNILPATSQISEMLTVTIAGQLFGIPILQVQDVLGAQSVTRVPLAAPEIVGTMNLRGRIVTAIRVRSCLGLPPLPEGSKEMSIVVQHDDELFSLIFDAVGDVMNLNINDHESAPGTLDQKFRDVSDGIYRLQGRLLVLLDVPKMLRGIGGIAA
jgi:purine-binding chemotaxis protein CheW